MNFDPNFFKGLWYDTIGQEDKAKKILSLNTLEEKKDYWKQVAIFCGVVGIAGAFFTYGISLLLLLVSARKMQLYYTKKQ
jgi:hypothetical protein